MKKNFKIIHINGISGLIAVFFIAVCLFCGFVIFPILGLKAAWNHGLSPYSKIPTIGLFQSFLLWAFITLNLVAFFKNKVSIKISNEDVLKDPELKNMLKNVQTNTVIEPSETKETEEEQQEIIK